LLPSFASVNGVGWNGISEMNQAKQRARQRAEGNFLSLC